MTISITLHPLEASNSQGLVQGLVQGVQGLVQGNIADDPPLAILILSVTISPTDKYQQK